MAKKHNRFEGVTAADLIDDTVPPVLMEGRRRYNTLTPVGNQLVGAVDGWLVAHPGFHSPSTVGRGLRVSTVVADHILSWMDRNGVYVQGSGNGCWRKYGVKA